MIKLFSDVGLTSPIEKLEEIVVAGLSQEIEIYILNNSNGELIDINISSNNENLIILDHPKKLLFRESAAISIRVNSNIDMIEAITGDLTFQASYII